MAIPPIPTPRLELVCVPPEVMEALQGDDLEAAGELLGVEPSVEWAETIPDVLRLRQIRASVSERQWLVRAMVLRGSSPTLVGSLGFHAPPDQRGAVEVGYTVLTAHRRRGYAKEAVLSLLSWAGGEHGVRRFVASVGPWNLPSLALVRKLGFVQVGTRWDDEDGEELVFELERPAPSG